MPEGDTLFRTAVRLRAVLWGEVVLAAQSREPRLGIERIVSKRMACIEARGKHLLIHFGATSTPAMEMTTGPDAAYGLNEPPAEHVLDHVGHVATRDHANAIAKPAGTGQAGTGQAGRQQAGTGQARLKHDRDDEPAVQGQHGYERVGSWRMGRERRNGRLIAAGASGRSPRSAETNFPNASHVQPSREPASEQDVLHSHLGMTGSWHLYQLGEPWRKPAHRAAVVLRTRSAVAVCFSPKTIELLSADAFRRHRYLQQLGPDLLAEELDEEEILRRFRIHDATPLGQAVMNQTIACGIGNVYKSEVLFMLQLNPFQPVRALTDTQLLSLIHTARLWMQKNLDGYPRTTRLKGDGGGRKWVYGRQGAPCFTCQTPIQMQRQGDLGRSTYWCPTCQAAIEPAPHTSVPQAAR